MCLVGLRPSRACGRGGGRGRKARCMHACDDCIHACDDYILHACTQRLESLPNTMQAPRGARGSAAGRRIGLIHTQSRLGHGHGPYHVTNSSYCCRPVARAPPPRRSYTPPAQPAPGFAILCSCCSVSHLLRKCSMFSITKMKCACGSTVTDAIELYTVRLAGCCCPAQRLRKCHTDELPVLLPVLLERRGVGAPRSSS